MGPTRSVSLSETPLEDLVDASKTTHLSGGAVLLVYSVHREIERFTGWLL